MLIKIRFNREEEVLNFECRRENGHSSEDEITSAKSEGSLEDVAADEELVLMLRITDPKTTAPREYELLSEKLSAVEALKEN